MGDTLPAPCLGASVSVSPDRSMVAVSSGLAVTILDAHSREVVAEVTLPPGDGTRIVDGRTLAATPVWTSAWTPDGSRLLLGAAGDLPVGPGGDLAVVDTTTWQVDRRAQIGVTPQPIEPSPDGRSIAVAGRAPRGWWSWTRAPSLCGTPCGSPPTSPWWTWRLTRRPAAGRRRQPGWAPRHRRLHGSRGTSRSTSTTAAGCRSSGLPAGARSRPPDWTAWSPSSMSTAGWRAPDQARVVGGADHVYLVPGATDELRVLAGAGRAGGSRWSRRSSCGRRARSSAGTSRRSSGPYLPGRPHQPTCTDLD